MGAETHSKLMHHAGAILSRRQHSRGELQAKLGRLGDPKDIERTLDRLEELGLLNDADYAYNFAFCHIREMSWGPRKVYDSLIQRHVAPQLAESAIDRVHLVTSEEAVLNQYIDKLGRRFGFPRDRKGVRKLYSQLRSRGFHEDLIWNSLRNRIPAAFWRQNETGD
jgi:regulatory protein